MKNTILLFAVGMALLQLPLTSQAETGRWYDIEVIIFTNRDTGKNRVERWDNQLQMQLDPQAFELFDPATAEPLSPEASLAVNKRLEDKITNPVSGLLAEEDLIYKKEAEKIDKYYSTKVILHTGWRQLFTDDTPVKLHFFGGTDYSETYNLSGFIKPPPEENNDPLFGPVIPEEPETEVNTLEEAEEIAVVETSTEEASAGEATPEAPAVVIGEDGLPIAPEAEEPPPLTFEELLAMGADKPKSIQVHPWDVESIYEETLVPTQLHLWQLDGFITINLEHYMHIATDFVVRKPVKETQRRVRPNIAEEASNAIARLLEDNFSSEDASESGAESSAENQSDKPPLTVETVTVERLKQFKLSQMRKLKSHDTHFIDHPLLGIMIAIRPYKPVEDLEQRLGLGE